MDALEHLVMKCRDAMAGGFDSLSTGEQLAAALALNRNDWLAKMNYTIAEAIERIGPDWMNLIPAASKALEKTNTALAKLESGAHEESILADVSEAVDVSATLVIYGDAPGYRDASFTFDLQRPGAAAKHRICFRISPKDGETVARHIRELHRWAWNRGKPLDVQPGEQRPSWID